MYNNAKDVGRWFQYGGDVERFDYKLISSSVVLDLVVGEEKVGDMDLALDFG